MFRLISRGARFTAVALAAVAAMTVGLLAACGANKAEHEASPDVAGSTLTEAEAVLVAWCENVRLVVEPVVDLAGVDPGLVRVAYQYLDSAEPGSPPPAGTLREGWASAAQTASPTPSPAQTRAGLVPRVAVLAATGSSVGQHLPDAPVATNVCQTGRVPTVHLRLEAEVPDLHGVPVTQALALLAQRGIDAAAMPQPYDPAALVERQSAAPGARVPLRGDPAASTVEITPGEVPVQLVLVDVPGVEHMGATIGCAVLRDAGFECSVLTAGGEPEWQPDWEIVSQWPRTPARIVPGATVTVVVAGPAQRVVPDVHDLPYRDACEDLRRVNLICDAVGELGRNQVSWQSPEPNATVTPGTVVSLQFEPVPWYEGWWGRLVLLFVGGIAAGLGGVLVKVIFGSRRRRGQVAARR